MKPYPKLFYCTSCKKKMASKSFNRRRKNKFVIYCFYCTGEATEIKSGGLNR